VLVQVQKVLNGCVVTIVASRSLTRLPSVRLALAAKPVIQFRGSLLKQVLTDLYYLISTIILSVSGACSWEKISKPENLMGNKFMIFTGALVYLPSSDFLIGVVLHCYQGH
jgi:hypothetical protein